MGVVYVAEQTEPVRRRVALKLIKGGMDSRELLGRFHSERQALALMNHPNIARILDAGSTEDGRPYFVMEVQHAHQKGVIHRDLKPSNILVEEVDGKSTPKVIDFGVAKALHQPLSDITLHTRLGGIIGTPEYMSPEQAESSGLDVDTRADVYSLGAILYELLTGLRPFDFREAGPSGSSRTTPSSGSARVAAASASARALATPSRRAPSAGWSSPTAERNSASVTTVGWPVAGDTAKTAATRAAREVRIAAPFLGRSTTGSRRARRTARDQSSSEQCAA